MKNSINTTSENKHLKTKTKMRSIIIFLMLTFIMTPIVNAGIIPFYSDSPINDLGISGSGIGDFNGDGYDDFISGAFRNNGNKGAAYIFFGSSSINPSTTPSVSIFGVDNRNFGVSVSGNFDFNGDGFKDIIVGAYGYLENMRGRAYIFFGKCNPDPVIYASNADVIIDGANMYFAFCVAKAGDLNKDGIDDIAIGSPFSPSNTYAGQAFIFYGKKNYISSAAMIPEANADLKIQGSIPSGYLGYSISDLGDISGDNIDDIIIGEPVAGTPTGLAKIYYGGQNMDDVPDKVFIGPGTGSYSDFGISVAGLGDVNGNGSRDFIITDWAYPSLAYGSAYVYDGTTIPDASGFTTQLLFDITGEQSSNTDGRFGCSSAGIGDYNGDGLNDFLIGNHQFDDATTPYYGGRVYKFLGSATPQVISSPSGSQILFSGSSQYDRMGVSAAGAGDINGDGRNDAFFGAFGFHSSTPYIGASFLDLSTSPNTSYTTLYLKAFIQGNYSVPNHSQKPRMVNVSLFDINCKLIDEKNVLLSSNGDAIDANNISTLTPGIKFNNLPPVVTEEYYIVIKGLCSGIITTWSSFKVNMTKGGTYGSASSPINFTDASEKAFGNNQIEVEPGVFALYNGDADGDCSINLSDITNAYNDARNFVSGNCCLKSDLNGDGFVDVTDYTIIYNNSVNFVSSIGPCNGQCF